MCPFLSICLSISCNVRLMEEHTDTLWAWNGFLKSMNEIILILMEIVLVNAVQCKHSLNHWPFFSFTQMDHIPKLVFLESMHIDLLKTMRLQCNGISNLWYFHGKVTIENYSHLVECDVAIVKLNLISLLSIDVPVHDLTLRCAFIVNEIQILFHDMMWGFIISLCLFPLLSHSLIV